jgi:mono/diheme cytochrome c family protein
MSRYLVLLAAILALLFVSEAEAQKKASDLSKADNSVYAELAKAPVKALSRRNPLENDPDSIPAGKILFGRHCAECHGNAAQGGKKAPSLRAPEVQNAEPGAIFWILTNGVVRRGMPVWSKLPEPQRWQLISFIKSLGAAPADSSSSPATLKEPSSRPR